MSIKATWWLHRASLQSPAEASDATALWIIEFSRKFSPEAEEALNFRRQQQSKTNSEPKLLEAEKQATERFERVVQLEPRVAELFERARAGEIWYDDLMLTYFWHRLEWILGPNRQDDGDDLLFTKEAFDYAHSALFDALPVSFLQ